MAMTRVSPGVYRNAQGGLVNSTMGQAPRIPTAPRVQGVASPVSPVGPVSRPPTTGIAPTPFTGGRAVGDSINLMGGRTGGPQQAFPGVQGNNLSQQLAADMGFTGGPQAVGPDVPQGSWSTPRRSPNPNDNNNISQQDANQTIRDVMLKDVGRGVGIGNLVGQGTPGIGNVRNYPANIDPARMAQLKAMLGL